MLDGNLPTDIQPIIRRATEQDLLAFYGKNTRPSCKAWVAIWQGEIACVAGIALERFGMVAFSDVKPGIVAPKITIWRTAKTMLEQMRTKGLPLIVAANRRTHNSGKFLRSLGFVLLSDHDDNLIYGLKK